MWYTDHWDWLQIAREVTRIRMFLAWTYAKKFDNKKFKASFTNKAGVKKVQTGWTEFAFIDSLMPGFEQHALA